MGMQQLNREMAGEFDRIFETRKKAILEAGDTLVIRGTTYYVSSNGDDGRDGRTPETAWKTLGRVSQAYLNPGDGVLFQRGDLFRGSVQTRPGVCYGAYGTGEKPKFYGGEFSLADPALWEDADPEHHIWKCTKKMPDAGTLVFNDG